MRYYILAFLVFCSVGLFAQNPGKTDSLKKVLKTDISDREKVDVYVSLVQQYKKADSVQTVHYTNKAVELAKKAGYPEGKIDALYEAGTVTLLKGDYIKTKQLYNKLLKEAEDIQYLRGKAQILDGLGLLEYYQNNYSKTLEYYLESLKIKEELGDKREEALSLNSIGAFYMRQGNYNKALEYFFQSLEISKHLSNKDRLAAPYTNIGIIYDYQGYYDKALDYHLRSLEISKSLGNKRGMASSYNNIGMIYEYQEDYTEALEYHSQSLEIHSELGNKNGVALSHSNVGNIYFARGNYTKALEYHLESLEVQQELNNKDGMALSYNNIGSVYLKQHKSEEAFNYYSKSLEIINSLGSKTDKPSPLIGLGEVFIKQKKWKQAKKHLYEALSISKEVGLVESVMKASEQLTLAEKELGNYQAAYESYVLFKEMADSLQNEEQTKKLTRLEAEFEFKQEKDSIQSANEKKQIAFQQKIEKGNLRQRATFIGLGLAGLLLVVLFLFFQSKQRDNKLLKKQSKALKEAHGEVQIMNKELQTANEEIQSTNETLSITLDTVKHQRDDILSSINYAQRIQASILPGREYLQVLLPQHFVFFKPRDVVSGDFYWCAETTGKVILTAIDCTGHGVPGAFMSMIGNALLSNIVKERQICQADEILKQLHQGIRQALQQEETKNRDGMDLALVVIDFTGKTLEFAGAKNPLIYIQSNELKVIKGDKVPIGGEQTEVNRIFTAHKIDISQPTTFYLFSDGYQDQFGGPKGKKFMTKHFRDLLMEIHQRPMQEQNEIIDRTIQDWMKEGDEKQIDDILVIGVRV